MKLVVQSCPRVWLGIVALGWVRQRVFDKLTILKLFRDSGWLPSEEYKLAMEAEAAEAAKKLKEKETKEDKDKKK